MKVTAIHLGCLFKAPNQENVRLCMFVRELLELEQKQRELERSGNWPKQRPGEPFEDFRARVVKAMKKRI